MPLMPIRRHLRVRRSGRLDRVAEERQQSLNWRDEETALLCGTLALLFGERLRRELIARTHKAARCTGSRPVGQRTTALTGWKQKIVGAPTQLGSVRPSHLRVALSVSYRPLFESRQCTRRLL